MLCAKHTRTVANDNTVQFRGTTWLLHPPCGRSHLVRAKIEVQERFDGTLRFHHPDHGSLRATRLKG